MRAKQTLLKRLERLSSKSTNGSNSTTFLLPDGSKITMGREQAQQAYADALYGNNTPDSRIVTTAIGDNQSSGRLLALLRAIINPTNTQES
jgi:hypothetical protein